MGSGGQRALIAINPKTGIITRLWVHKFGSYIQCRKAFFWGDLLKNEKQPRVYTLSGSVRKGYNEIHADLLTLTVDEDFE